MSVYLILLFSLFSYRPYQHIDIYVQYLCIITIFFLYFRDRPKIDNRGDPIAKLIPFLFFIPYLCGITRFVNEGGFPIYRHIIYFSSTWLLYYIFKYHKMPEGIIIRTVTIVGLVMFCIQVFQVLFPEYAVFGIYDEEDIIKEGTVSEVRNGINRYKIGGHGVTLFCLYFYWQKLIYKVTKRNLIIFLIFLISMYLHLTRQVMVSCFVTLSLSLILVGKVDIKKYKFLIISITIAIIVAGGISFVKSTFADMAEETVNQVGSEDYVRYLAFQYFGGRIFASPLTMICGNGSSDEVTEMSESGLYPSDIGFVGEAYYYGLLWIALWLYTVWVILYKFRKYVPLYLKMYVFGSVLYSWGMFPYPFPGTMFLWVSMLYISSLHIRGINNKIIQKREYDVI